VDHLPEKRDVYSFPEQFALETVKSQFGAPTLGLLAVLLVPAMAGIFLALMGWDPQKLPAGNKLTDWQKLLIIVTFPNPLLPNLFLDDAQATQLTEELTTASRLAPFGAAGIKLFFEPFVWFLRQAQK